MNNSITDVPGVQVGHFTLADGEIQTGVTAVLPYPLSIRNRKLFIGSFARGNWNEWTGLHVAQDFGTFSSPIVLCNATTVGIAYDALITFGHEREKDLPIDNAWPPVVIGIDDGYLNDLRQRRVTHDDVLRTIQQAHDGPIECGSVGIGRGLCAFGRKGGVGEASCALSFSGKEYTLGMLLATNGAHAHDDEAAATRSAVSSFVLVIATDAPLLPEQLRQLAEAGLRGLDAIIRLDDGTQQLALAFSTGNTIDGAFTENFQLFKESVPGKEQITGLLAAAGACSRTALRRALENATTVIGRQGRRMSPLDSGKLHRLFSQPGQAGIK
jgi:D-aminopeptidase